MCECRSFVTDLRESSQLGSRISGKWVEVEQVDAFGHEVQTGLPILSSVVEEPRCPSKEAGRTPASPTSPRLDIRGLVLSR